jgi:hypothetical protein
VAFVSIGFHLREAAAALWRLVRLFAIIASTGAMPAYAQQSDAALERSVKAAFLYRFTDYVTWPQSSFQRPDSPLVIGVAADLNTVAELQTIVSGRVVRGHPIVIRQVREGDQAAGLHMLFVGGTLTPRHERWIRSLDGAVLVVTESDEALSRGSIINFVVTERRVRFEVSIDAANARSLSLASGLLSVALNVRKGSGLNYFPYFVRHPGIFLSVM